MAVFLDGIDERNGLPRREKLGLVRAVCVETAEIAWVAPDNVGKWVKAKAWEAREHAQVQEAAASKVKAKAWEAREHAQVQAAAASKAATAELLQHQVTVAAAQSQQLSTELSLALQKQNANAGRGFMCCGSRSAPAATTPPHGQAGGNAASFVVINPLGNSMSR
jgi:hypothetical protein